MRADAAATAATAVPAAAQRWVLAGLLGAVALNVHHVAAWALPLATGAAAWRVWAAQRPARLLGRYWRYAVLVILTLAVLISFRTLNGLDAGASLLVAMMALKLMETQRLRDWLIVLGGALFLLLAACLAAQALWLTPLYAAELWLLGTALYALGAGDRQPPAAWLMRNSARSLLLALPLALLLFLFFPRLSGALWSVPRDDEAVTGLGDTMSPGSISNLVDSEEPALRVRFDGPLPPREQRYWRGPILHLFDGNSWSRVHEDLEEPPEPAFAGEVYRYEVTLEPNSHGVLIGLDLPRRVMEHPRAVFHTFDYQFVSAEPISSAVSYRVESYLRHRSLEPLPEAVRELDLALPATRNPRARELAHSLRAAAHDDRAYVQAVLGYLQDNNFEYTRAPPQLGRNSIDDLLFRTHAGFCGHYASAFAMMMRAGGVPAHVVTGYLGGQLNRFGGYLLIRQSNAHAWTEVWLDGAGWVRVDPTAVIDATRLNEDFDEAGAAAGVSGLASGAARWFAGTMQVWQAVNAWWQDEFINFNSNRQLNLLGRLGFKERDYQTLIALLAVGATLWLSFLAWRGRSATDRRARDALGRSWRRLEQTLRRRASERAAHEGPVAYGERVAAERPELAATVRALTRQYAQLRYGRQYSVAELLRFERAVRLFSARSPRLRPAPATAATRR
jgi:transglutaminase-like putative cysteine protease